MVWSRAQCVQRQGRHGCVCQAGRERTVRQSDIDFHAEVPCHLLSSFAWHPTPYFSFEISDGIATQLTRGQQHI